MEEILKALQEGGSIRYFYLAGGYVVHDKNDNPTKIKITPMDFLDLNDKVKFSHTLNHGYPHYANNLRSNVYVLKS